MIAKATTIIQSAHDAYTDEVDSLAENAAFAAAALALVFPEGTDANAAAGALAVRIQNYESLRVARPLLEILEERGGGFEAAIATEANGLPVALLVLYDDDPPREPDEDGRVNTAVFGWLDMVFAQDYGFLATAGRDE